MKQKHVLNHVCKERYVLLQLSSSDNVLPPVIYLEKPIKTDELELLDYDYIYLWPRKILSNSKQLIKGQQSFVFFLIMRTSKFFGGQVKIRDHLSSRTSGDLENC